MATPTASRRPADAIPALSEIHSTSGKFDLLAKFYLEHGDDPGRFVTERVQTLPGVTETHTLIAFNAPTRAG